MKVKSLGSGVSGRIISGPLSGQTGMALVLTLLVVAIITAMVVEFAYGVYVSTNALYNWEAAQRLSLAAKSAVRFGSRMLAQYVAENNSYPTMGSFEITEKIPFDNIEGDMFVRIEDENSKFNLNTLVGKTNNHITASIDQFKRLLKALELDTRLADRVVDWIDTDSEPLLPDSEKNAKNGYLDSVDELLQIPGIDRTVYDKLFPYVTIYGGSTGATGPININSAEIPVLMSLSEEIDKTMAERIVAYRKITPLNETNNPLTKLDWLPNRGMGFSGINIVYKGAAFRVVARASSGNIRRVIETVLQPSGSKMNVLYWKET